MSRRIWTVAALALALAPAPGRAQTTGDIGVQMPVLGGPTRHTASIAGMYGKPLGEFGQNVKQGFGLDGAATFGLDQRGIFGLRGEVGYMQYSTKTEPFFVSSGFGGYELESETKSGVLTFGVGPQLMAPSGAIRPYVAATVGFARFATSTSINVPAEYSNTGEKETLDSRTISSDFILSFAGTGGIAFEMPAFGRGVLVDLGARYHRNGQAEYVSPEGVQYNGTGNPTVTPTESEANFVVYRIGVVIPIR